MKTLIITEHLGFSEKNYMLFSEINNIVENSIHDVSVAPVDLSNKLMALNFAVLNISELSSFQNGLIIGTTIKHAVEMESVHNSSRKVIYLWELDWLFDNCDYEKTYDTLTNKKIEFITRSQEHRNALKTFCGRDSFVLQEFELEKIWTLLE